MKIEKARKRDKARKRRKHGHRVGSKSVFIIQEIQRKRAIKIARKEKENGRKVPELQ